VLFVRKYFWGLGMVMGWHESAFPILWGTWLTGGLCGVVVCFQFSGSSQGTGLVSHVFSYGITWLSGVRSCPWEL
jgi:hypothetical protein